MLRIFQTHNGKCTDPHKLENVPQKLHIAYCELLAAVFGIICFVPLCEGCIIRLNSDNIDTIAWLQKSRCSEAIGFRMLALMELYKYKYGVKISTRYIRGVANRSAVSLSRGSIPLWLKRIGRNCEVD